jgi:phosphoglycolate phosphatase
MYKLAIFDMDGTVLNTIEDLTDSINFALAKNNMPLRTVKEVNSFVGNGIPVFIGRAVQPGTSKELLDKIIKDFGVYYKVHSADKTAPYDGVIELIKRLRASGVKTAVASNKDDYAVKDLCVKYFDGLFDYSIGRRDGMQTKPAPDMVDEVLNCLGFSKEEAVYIGDSDVDFLTAKNSGLAFLGCEWGFKGREFLRSLGAEITCEHPSMLYDYIVK